MSSLNIGFLNAYGLGPLSIDITAFQLSKDASHLKKVAREWFRVALMVHNTIFQVLGWMPALKHGSGLIRGGIGVGMFLGSFVVEHVFKEATFAADLRLTAVGQIARGVLEAFCPFWGFWINIAVDVIALQDIRQRTPEPSENQA